jgi:hypothetical protein
MSNNFGWLDNPDEVVRIKSGLPMPVFAQAAPHLKGSGEGKDVFYWELEEAVLGRVLSSWNQKDVGSCVSFGWGRAAQDLYLCQIVRNGEGWSGYEVATEPIYGGSRVEVGGQRGSYSDGSVGAWAAKWVSKWGILLRKSYGSIDLSHYDTQRCREWGAKGVPDELEPTARQYPIKTVSEVTTAEDARDAIANYKPISICGSQGRTMQRQSGGWCRVSGTWYHCQEVRGVCVAKGNHPAFVFQNSWGDYLGSTNNRVQLESGREITLPEGCYLSTFEEFERDARTGDTFTTSDAVGYPATDIPDYLFKLGGRR